MKVRAMATGGRKTRVKWTAEFERKLIDIWADFLEELDGKMMTEENGADHDRSTQHIYYPGAWGL